MNATKRLACLPAALACIFLLVGCAATNTSPNPTSGEGAGAGSSRHSRDVGAANAVPGFYFSDSWIFEYARSAALDTPPLRMLVTRGQFFGADKRGNVYSYTNPSGNECGNPCQVIASDALGKRHHEVTLPTLGTGDNPSGLFVDQNGSIYYMLGCSPIVQLSAGATGTNPKPVRTIAVPAYECEGDSYLQIVSQLFAASDGNLFMNGPYKKTAAYYNWPGSASGTAKPRVLITDLAHNPILGVDSKGNAWTAALGAAYKFGPNLSGRVGPAPLELQGISEGTLGALRISSRDQLVYEGLLGTTKAVLRISSLKGGKPTRLLILPGGFIGNELTSITF
jgi:hypothetical protein